MLPQQKMLNGSFFYEEVMWSRWAIPGILSPCWDEVGDISAPVAINRML